MPDIIIGNLPNPATTPLTGAERVPMDQRVGGNLVATALTPGLGYAIVTLGSTNWTACGVPAGVTPAVGLVFTCSAVGTGTGTAQQVETVDAAASDIAALAAPANLSYDPATRLLASSTGTDVTLPLAGPTTAGLLPPTNDALSLASLTVTGTLTAPHIHGALAGPLYVHVRNHAGVSLPAGSTVHVVDNQGDTDRMLVILARADDPATLPANGILLETLAPNADGHAVNVGELTGFNTSGLTAGAQVFVALTGGLTMTRPATNPQAIATVGRVHSSTGSILVNASPVLSSVAFSGAYGDLSGRPTLATVATTGAYGDLTGRPALATVATTGAYGDLSGRPTLATVATTGAYGDLTGRPSLATVATSGAYTDLTGRPTLATVATTGAYSDLSGRPPEISQVDAEAGSATTFSLWTAQRWRQAAAAWWQTVSSALGRSLVAAADAPAARTVLGLGTAAPLDVAASGNASTSQVVKGDDTRLSDARTPTAHTQAASTISDSTATGRAVLTAADASAARTVLGLGTAAPLDVATTGNATTSQVVKGDDTRLSDARTPTAHTQAASTISDSTSTGRALLTAADAPAARSAISAAGSGAITGSGLTMATARLLGRTTASSGAVEEIQIVGGTFAGGVLTLPIGGGAAARTDYKPGNFISSLDTLTVAGAGMGSTSLVVLRSFVLEASMTIDQLIVRITTAAAGSTFQLAIYNSSANGDPTGLPLANTASLTGAATGNIAGSITPLSLTANKLYWMAIAADNTTLAFMQGVANSLKQAYFHGAESLAFILTSTAVSFNRTASATYGTWPDLTGVSTSIDTINRGAIQFFRIASVP